MRRTKNSDPTMPLLCVLLSLAVTALLGAALPVAEANAEAEAIAPVKAPFPMPELQRPTFSDRTFDIRDYGAVEGGKMLCTASIAKAIAACAGAGGGRVLVPKGVWLSGPIHLKSNIELHLAADAEVRLSQRYEDYLPVVLIQRVELNVNGLVINHARVNKGLIINHARELVFDNLSVKFQKP